MGRKWVPRDAQEADAQPVRASVELTAFGAWLGAADRDAAAIRRAMQLPVSWRTWHRVYPTLPREARPDGTLVLWHPDEEGWPAALEAVHAGRAIHWRKTGAYLQRPGSDRVVLHDFAELDALELADWSLVVPDARFRTFCARVHAEAAGLGELLARWALELGPREAGTALLAQSSSSRAW